MKCGVERGIESIPQTIEGEVWLFVVLDGLNSREFSFVNLIHKFPKASTLVRYLLNLIIEEGFFCDLDHFLEHFPGF